jgi:tetratricopeptide (TPR) repeat protein
MDDGAQGRRPELSAVQRPMYEKLTSRPFQLLALVFLGFGLYCFSLDYPFVFDSRIYILGNPLITDNSAFLQYFRIEEFMDTYLNRLSHRDLVSSFLLRPVAYLSFRLNHLYGGFVPAGFRLVNISIHIGNALLLHQILSSVLRLRNDGSKPAPRLAIPFFASLLFLVHPLQTQSVTYVAQRFTSFAAFFYLTTMLLYIQSRTARRPTVRTVCYGASIATLVLGLLTKESVLTLPVTLLLVDRILLQQPLKETVTRLLPHFACMGLVPFQVLRINHEMREAEILLPSLTSIVGDTYGRAEYAITQIRATLSYLRLLLLPINLNFDPDYPLYRTLLHPEIVISIGIWIAILTTGICLLRKRERTVNTDLAAFSIFWYPVALSVSSSFIPLSDLMFEHRSYLPSVAFFTGTVAWLDHAAAGKSIVHRNVTIGVLCLFALIFSGTTVKRNLTYSSRITMWQDTVRKNPKKARPYFALGNAYLDEKRYDEGLPYLKKSLELDPGYLDAHLSLGTAYLQMEQPQKAIKLYEAYLQRFPSTRIVQMNLALAYAETGRFSEAIVLLQQLTEKRDEEAGLLGLLAELYYRLGKHDDALAYLRRAIIADRKDPIVDLSDILTPLREKILEEVARGVTPKRRP